DASARVPDRFRERQWSRLPAGERAEAFAERARRLLDNGEAGVAAEAGPAHTRRAAMPSIAKSSLSKWLIAGLGAMVVALAAFIALRAPIKEPAVVAATKSVTDTAPPPAMPKPEQNSVA